MSFTFEHFIAIKKTEIEETFYKKYNTSVDILSLLFKELDYNEDQHFYDIDITTLRSNAIFDYNWNRPYDEVMSWKDMIDCEERTIVMLADLLEENGITGNFILDNFR